MIRNDDQISVRKAAADDSTRLYCIHLEREKDREKLESV